MALTPLEAIALKLKEEKEKNLESILSISGSAAIAKNEYGVTIVDDQNAASSLLFKSLTKTKIDNDELLKAIDVEVKELKPDIPRVNRELVPKELYDEQITIGEDLRNQIKILTTRVDGLNAEVTDLSGKLQNEINKQLSIEQTNDILVNQLDTLSGTINDFSNQIQSAVQKSVDESILRASLQSQNQGFKAQIEALIKQIDSLNSIIEGLQSQLGAVQQQQAIQQGTQAQAMAAGADVLGGSVIVKIKTKSKPAENPFFAKFNWDEKDSKWVNGEGINFVNNDKKAIDVTIDITNPTGIPWLSADSTSFSVAPSGTKDVNFTLNISAAKGKDAVKLKRGWSGTGKYTGGKVKVSIKMADGKIDSKEYSATMWKTNPDDWQAA